MNKLDLLILLLDGAVINNLGPSLRYELLPHFYYLTKSLSISNQIYIPMPKNFETFDGAIWCLNQKKFIQSFQYKIKIGEAFWGPKNWDRLISKYNNVDILDVGFIDQKQFKFYDKFINENWEFTTSTKVKINDYSQDLISLDSHTESIIKNIIKDYDKYNPIIEELSYKLIDGTITI